MSKSVSAARSPGGRVGALHAGSKNSVTRLNQLGFDPIGALVEAYRKVEIEIERQELIQSGALVEMGANGRPRSYRAEVHHALLDKLIAIGDKLLRYRYGRVPEKEVERANKTKALIIELTAEGQTYVVNGEDDNEMPDGPDGFVPDDEGDEEGYDDER